MAEKTLINGVNVATDTLTTLNGQSQVNPQPVVERVKIVSGEDGVGTDVSASNPMPVKSSTLPVSSVTRDGNGLVTAFTEDGQSWIITRDGNGYISTILPVG